MIVTPHFTFIHLHKTGGQFVNRLLLAFIPGAVRLGYHYPRSMLPAQFRALPAVGMVRNPWDWYASWDAFNRLNPKRNHIFRTLSEAGRQDFKTTISRMLRLGEDTAEAQALRAEIITHLPVSIEGNRGAGITRRDLDSFRDPDIGYLTWLACRMFCVNGRMDEMVFGKMEDLRADMLRILKQIGSEVPEPLREAIISAPPVNTSPHPPYRECYDDELKELVAEKDRPLIERFDYRF